VLFAVCFSTIRSHSAVLLSGPSPWYTPLLLLLSLSLLLLLWGLPLLPGTCWGVVDSLQVVMQGWPG